MKEKWTEGKADREWDARVVWQKRCTRPFSGSPGPILSMAGFIIGVRMLFRTAMCLDAKPVCHLGLRALCIQIRSWTLHVLGEFAILSEAPESIGWVLGRSGQRITQTVFLFSFPGRDSKASPKKRVDVRLSRTSSMERGKEREEAWSFDGVSESKRTAAKGSEENKENLIVNSELKDDLLVYQDEEALNDSIISGEGRAGSAGPC